MLVAAAALSILRLQPMRVALLIASAPASQVPAEPPPQPAQAQPSAQALVDLGDGALAYVPAAIGPAPAPLLILLHGAGGRPEQMVARFRAEADRRGFLLLAPRSAGTTWDVILDSGRADRPTDPRARVDPPRIEAALARLRARAAVDSRRVALGGFSDGASYALSLAPLRPDLYRHILAFSPGMVIRLEGRRGRQDVFLAHGRSDRVLPFANAAGRLVPVLEGQDHRVTFRPFEGGHEVPRDVVTAAVNAWLGPPQRPRP
jgi:phospholipase/carboxylesterase